MTPTNELRFVERHICDETTDLYGHIVRVLQQRWKRVRYEGEVDEFAESEWRDVPIEKESKKCMP